MPDAYADADADAVAATLADSKIDTSVPHSARRYDYWLGGKNHFAADRASGDAIAEEFPTIRPATIENRWFLRRAVTYLAAEAGIRQFLDIGTGLPTMDNTHEVAQRIAPTSRIVYVDNDPLVMVHARALLTGTPEGATSYIEADLRQPEFILTHDDLTGVLDMSQPVALMLIAVMHFLADSDDPAGILARLIAALPAGSFVVLTHAVSDFMSEETQRGIAAKDPNFHLRRIPQVAALFHDAGLDVVPPGVVSVSDWRAEAEEQPRPEAAEISWYGGVARIPADRRRQ